MSVGCRTGQDNQIDLLERELRSQEDYIYELEDYVVEYSEKLRECRCTRPHERVIYSEPTGTEKSIKRNSSKTNHVKRPQTEKDVFEDDPSEMPIPEDVEIDMEPAIEQPEPETDPEPINLEELDVPELEISDPVSSTEPEDLFEDEIVYEEVEQTRTHEPLPEVIKQVSYEEEPTRQRTQLVYIPDPSDYTEAEEQEEEIVQQTSKQVVEEKSIVKERVAERVVITELFRGAGKKNAPTSLLTVVEARDAYDEPVDLNGKISLMIMTADKDAPKRIHRWDFTDEETQMAWQSSDLGVGLHLELPLDETKLPPEAVELWVRVMMADGRKLLTQIPFAKQELVAIDDMAAEDEALAAAKPLPTSEATEPAEQAVAQAEPVKEALRVSTSPSNKDKPRWRASMQRSTSFAKKGSSTSTSGKMQWKSQPAGGRMPQKRSFATRPQQQKQSSPRWVPYR